MSRLLQEADISSIINLLIGGNKNVFGFIASDEKGILPHEIPNNSLLIVEGKSKYDIGDFIVIKDKRYADQGYRIIKANTKNEKDYIEKIMLSLNKFSKTGW